MNGWISDILALASNTGWVIGIFIFFTILLHILFIIWFPLSPRIWKMADYLWLSLVFLSLLGLVGEAKQFRAETAHNEKEWDATQSLNDVRNWFSNYQIFICEEAKNRKNRKTGATDYYELCQWLEGRINDLNLMRKDPDRHPELAPSLIRGLARYTTIIPQPEQEILISRMAKYNEKRALNLANIKALQRSGIQQLMVIIAPVMFALALAIRFTKVTAEYRQLDPTDGKTEKKKP